jgi:hypothetical protein
MPGARRECGPQRPRRSLPGNLLPCHRPALCHRRHRIAAGGDRSWPGARVAALAGCRSPPSREGDRSLADGVLGDLDVIRERRHRRSVCQMGVTRFRLSPRCSIGGYLVAGRQMATSAVVTRDPGWAGRSGRGGFRPTRERPHPPAGSSCRARDSCYARNAPWGYLLPASGATFGGSCNGTRGVTIRSWVAPFRWPSPIGPM